MSIQDQLKELTPEQKEEASRKADDRLERFSVVWAELGNSPLTKGEVALLRTYLVTEISGLLPSSL